MLGRTHFILTALVSIFFVNTSKAEDVSGCRGAHDFNCTLIIDGQSFDLGLENGGGLYNLASLVIKNNGHLHIRRGNKLSIGRVNIPGNLQIGINSDILLDGNEIQNAQLVVRGLLDASPNQQIFKGIGTVLFPKESGPNFTAYPEWWGAIGNGSTDDTGALQAALKSLSLSTSPGLSSETSLIINSGKIFRVTDNLFVFNHVNIIGRGLVSHLKFTTKDNGDGPTFPLYWVNFGIQSHGLDVNGRDVPQVPQAYSGVIDNVKFLVTGSLGHVARLLFFHSTFNVTMQNCRINTQAVSYRLFPDNQGLPTPQNRISITGGNQDGSWCLNCHNQNVLFQFNTIKGQQPGCLLLEDLNQPGRKFCSHYVGGEGLSMSGFNITYLENSVDGVGDDPIAFHMVTGGLMLGNKVTSPDGRIFIGSSTSIRISGNEASRIQQPNGSWATGIALLYVGPETFDANTLRVPENVTIEKNLLTYPADNKDIGYAIYVTGSRNVIVSDNTVINNHDTMPLGAVRMQYGGISVNPAYFNGIWSDPTQQDLLNVARPKDIKVTRNVFTGTFPLSIYFTRKSPNDLLSCLLSVDNIWNPDSKNGVVIGGEPSILNLPYVDNTRCALVTGAGL
jgi:hypothetical protein